uniref:Uncharacterized protein n=1 Tax=Rhizophora mucronata TaxID=61149 RepID=A0A2P2N6K7_RHIMU
MLAFQSSISSLGCLVIDPRDLLVFVTSSFISVCALTFFNKLLIKIGSWTAPIRILTRKLTGICKENDYKDVSKDKNEAGTY